MLINKETMYNRKVTNKNDYWTYYQTNYYERGIAGGEWRVVGKGYSQNLLVLKIKFCTAIVRVVFSCIYSGFSMSNPFKIKSSFLCFVRFLKMGI